MKKSSSIAFVLSGVTAAVLLAGTSVQALRSVDEKVSSEPAYSVGADDLGSAALEDGAVSLEEHRLAIERLRTCTEETAGGGHFDGPALDLSGTVYVYEMWGNSEDGMESVVAAHDACYPDVAELVDMNRHLATEEVRDAFYDELNRCMAGVLTEDQSTFSTMSAELVHPDVAAVLKPCL